MRKAGVALSTLVAAWGFSASAEPLEIYQGRLFLPATVAGEATLALLDSGAEMSIIDDDFAARLGLVGTGSATARGTGAASMEARFAGPVAVEGGGITLHQTVAILDLGEVSERLIGRPVDLILGRELFDLGRWRIDISGGTIDRIDPAAAPRGVRLPLGMDRGLPTIPVQIEGGDPVQAVFDLGNGSEVLVGRAYAERIGLTSPDRVVGRRTGGGLGGAHERDLVTLRSLRLAGREFHDVPAAIDPGDNAADLNIGTSILRHFLITSDFAAGDIWLEPREIRP